MMFNWLSKKAQHWARPADDFSFAVYEQVAAASRDARLYERFDIEDTLDGRFDVLVLFAALTVRRLSLSGEAGKRLAQGVVDTMFADMDLSLHEMGVSENKVGKKVKTMAKAFMGRMKAYSDALDGDALDGGAIEEMLVAALERNIYRDRGANGASKGLAEAVLLVVRALDDIDDAGLGAEAIGRALNHAPSNRAPSNHARSNQNAGE